MKTTEVGSVLGGGMRKSVFFGIVCGAALSWATPAAASVFTDDLSRCLVNNTTTADKTLLIRWIFGAISVADGVKDLVRITDAQRDELSRRTADLFTRLITKDCKQASVAAIKNDGPEALKSSFGVLGEIAMGGLMKDPKVDGQISVIAKYFDSKAFEEFVRDAGLEEPKI